MMFENWYDSHIHSRNSHDGKDSVSAICEIALKQGMRGVAFSDHCDTDAPKAAGFQVGKRVISDTRNARARFGDALAISAGLELGEPHHNPALARKLIAAPELDFVIGSLHCLRDDVDFYYMDYDNFSEAEMDAVMRRYYRELAELVDCGAFDVVGHINYQARYMSAAAREKLHLPNYYGELTDILRTIARMGKGIEINTSGLRKGLGDTLPSLDVVRLFKEAGGEIVTLGSDTHDAKSVGAGIFEAMERLKEAGFDSFSFFERRKPTAIPIA